MYRINDMVVYGNQGVCKVIDVGPLNIAGHGDKTYYTLNPVYQKGTLIYAPVENPKSVMRPVLKREECQSLIKDIPEIETIETKNDRERELLYRTAIRTCDPRELVKVIKTVYFRRKARLASGKKRIILDEKYTQLAEEQLYQEMAYVMDKNKDTMADYISEQVLQKATV